MKKDLIDTIMEKEFHVLTELEREELSTYCTSEDEYNQMKEVFLGMEQMTRENLKPKAETKQRLDELFDATYPKAAPIWYSSVLAVVVPKGKPLYRQPLAQIAAIALLALLLVPFWSSDSQIENPESTQQVAQLEQLETRQKSQNLKAEPVADTNEDPIILKRETETKRSEEPILVASAAPAPGASATGASASASNHPDGVFVAVSQPASEAPEMFDLLTATF